MFSLTDPSLPFGQPTDHEGRGGLRLWNRKPRHNLQSLEDIVWSIQQPVISQYRQMLNEITPIRPPNL